MTQLNLYRRALAGMIMASSLFLLGACARPENAMVSAFRQTTDAMLLAKVQQVAAMRATARSGGSRGVVDYGNSGLGYGYSSNTMTNSSNCLAEAQSVEKVVSKYWQMVGRLIQCNERQLIGSSNGLWGTMYPYLSYQGQAYMRYLSDFRNVSGQFVNGYGLGYQWGYNSSWGLGNDQLLMWNNLGGSGNGFFNNGTPFPG
ncbi:MAG: hypothetical protein KDD51_06680 [Bdellovibrionales bacterium]|nr:hypothetical protein [Bdellovibrionales bacterium]